MATSWWTLRANRSSFAHATTPIFRAASGQIEYKKAVLAIAHVIVTTACHFLAHQKTYQDPGGDHYDRRPTERVRSAPLHRIRRGRG